MAHVSSTIKIVQDHWDNSGVTIHPSSNMYKLMRALVSQYDRTFSEIENVRDSHHITNATGQDLDKIGRLISLDRNDGESDAKYRARLKLKFRVGLIGTTFDEFSQFMAVLLETDIDNLQFPDRLAADPATAYVRADSSIFNASALTRAEIKEFAGEAVPAGHEVKLEESGTFILKQDGEADDPAKGLTSDSISTGGTLAQDV